MKYLEFERYQENGNYLWYECNKIAEFTGGNVKDYWYMNKLKRDTSGVVKLDINTHLVIKKYIL